MLVSSSWSESWSPFIWTKMMRSIDLVEETLEWIQLLLTMVIMADAVFQEARCIFFGYDHLVLYYFPEVIKLWVLYPGICPMCCTLYYLLLLLYSDLTDLYILDFVAVIILSDYFTLFASYIFPFLHRASLFRSFCAYLGLLFFSLLLRASLRAFRPQLGFFLGLTIMIRTLNKK